ncbi:transposase domain-containing protein [Streptomyces cavernae]|uniref:transposase domain-containing protein n=1 Tax=Streptomyces cavernae TaxID=2259034 RepID=UPI002368127F|nr:transposase domain-containing protein [Streptomyces cavernae]
MSADVGGLSGSGLLIRVYPPGLVDRVVAACGRAEHRRRLLQARLVVYFVLALALFSPAPYLEVMRHLVEGLRGQGPLGDWHIPAKSSLFRARQRLGTEPLRVRLPRPQSRGASSARYAPTPPGRPPWSGPCCSSRTAKSPDDRRSSPKSPASDQHEHPDAHAHQTRDQKLQLAHRSLCCVMGPAPTLTGCSRRGLWTGTRTVVRW